MKLFKRKIIFFIIIVITILGIAVSGFFILNLRGVSVTKLYGVFDSDDVFNVNFDELQASIGDVDYVMSYDEEIYEIIECLDKIRVEDKVIYQTDGQFPNIPNLIKLNGYTIGFNNDFSLLFVHKSISSAYPQKFKVINKRVVRKLFDLIANSESTRINTTLEITNIKTGSYLEDVSVSVESFVLEGFSPSVIFELKNNSDEQRSYGPKQNLYYKENGELILCRTFKHKSNRKWVVNSFLKTLPPNETITENYSFYLDDVTKEGTYRLESDALWFEFTLQKTDN